MGFLFATFVTYIIGSNHADLPSWGLVAVAVAVGIFCGLLTMFVTYCGLFLAGFGLGFFIGIAIFFIVETFYHVSIKWIPFGVLLGLSLIFSLLTLRWQKGFFIVATSIIGAALITVGVDYFIEEFVLINYAWQRIMAGDEKEDCWVSWVILAVWPVMFILGNVVQFCKTGRSYTHRKSKFKLCYKCLSCMALVQCKSFLGMITGNRCVCCCCRDFVVKCEINAQMNAAKYAILLLYKIIPAQYESRIVV